MSLTATGSTTTSRTTSALASYYQIPINSSQYEAATMKRNKTETPFVNQLRLNQPGPQVEPPTIGGKREAPPMSGTQVRAAGNIQAQFGNSLNTRQGRRRGTY